MRANQYFSSLLAANRCCSAKRCASRSWLLRARRPLCRASASQLMPASVSCRVSHPSVVDCSATRRAASKSISIPSLHGQPAERQTCINRVRWLRLRRSVVTVEKWRKQEALKKEKTNQTNANNYAIGSPKELQSMVDQKTQVFQVQKVLRMV